MKISTLISVRRDYENQTFQNVHAVPKVRNNEALSNDSVGMEDTYLSIWVWWVILWEWSMLH